MLVSYLFVAIFSIGVVFAFLSNEKVNESIRDVDGTVNSAIDNSLGFVEDTQRVRHILVYEFIPFCMIKQEANLTVDRYDEVNAFVQCEINSKLFLIIMQKYHFFVFRHTYLYWGCCY